jgi:nicotinamidase-related amidase
MQTLTLPSFYDPAQAADWAYRPDQQAVFEAAELYRRQYNITPAGSDRFRLQLLIDVQKDFCFPEGSLYVAGRAGDGAIKDNQRLAEFIYRNLGVITDITTTMDTHFAFQIFFASFWLDANGEHPAAHTVITTDDVRSGKLVPNPAVATWLCNGNYTWLCKQVEFYCAELERAGKYTLYIWPFHCLLGSDGHNLAGVIQAARLFQSFTRGTQSNCEIKGGHPLTENYSVLRPEVVMRWDGQPLAQKNTKFIETLLTADAVVMAGEADSHCVRSSIDDLLDEIVAKDPALARKVYIMTDCMSSVTVPDGAGGFVADFTPEAEAAHQRFADAGMNLVKSTDPLDTWPGLKL